MVTPEPKQLVAEAFSRWEKGESTVFDVVADDVRWKITGSSSLAGTWTSKSQFMAEGLGPISSRLEAMIRPVVESVVAEGDTVVVHWRGHAVALDGVPYDNEYCWIMRVAGDEVVDVVAWFDAAPLNDLIDRVQPAQ